MAKCHNLFVQQQLLLKLYSFYTYIKHSNNQAIRELKYNITQQTVIEKVHHTDLQVVNDSQPGLVQIIIAQYACIMTEKC